MCQFISGDCIVDLKEVLKMSDTESHKNKLTRRELLKAALLGAGLVYVSSALGCSPETGDRAISTTPEMTPPLQGASRKGWYNPKPSPWFVALEGDQVRCTLCPKSCELGDGERSPCRVRENQGGVGYTLSHGNPTLVQEDPIERAPFYHVMPASRVLSLSTVGCNLSCHFCEVWDMALVAPEEVHAYHMPPEVVIAHAQAAGVGAIGYAFGEPVVFFEYMLDVARLAHQKGLFNLVHTAGYIEPEPLRALCPYIDGVNIDLKGFDPAFYRELVGGELAPVLRTLEILKEEGVHTEITHLVIPTINDDMDVLREMCSWIINTLGPDVPLHFSRFYPLYKLSGLPRTPVSTLDQARQIAMNAGLNFVYVAKVVGHEGENTFCPNCGETVIRRLGFVVDAVDIVDGLCRFCGTAVPGKWV
jgi:pyruvate formate lyase activating enzyme